MRAGAAVLVATHSHLFVDVDVADRHLLGLLAGPGGTRLVNLTEDLLGDLAPIAGSLLADVGLDRAAPIALTRGVLIVEGEHDRLVIRRFFGAALDRERIRVMPIRGTSNAMSLAEAQLFGVLGVPVCVLFDGIRANSIRGQPPDDLSGEEAKLRRLLDHFEHLAHEGHEIGWVEFNVPDVIAALPMPLVRRAYPEVVANDWSAITEQWAGLGRPSFKPFALKALGLKRTPADDFVNAVLRIAREDDVPSSDLLRAVKEAVAWLTRPSLRPEEEDHRGKW